MQINSSVRLNGISGEKLKSLVVTVLKERNKNNDNPTGSAVQTIIETRGYFVTQGELYDILYGMVDKKEIEFIPTEDFPGGGYRLCK